MEADQIPAEIIEAAARAEWIVQCEQSRVFTALLGMPAADDVRWEEVAEPIRERTRERVRLAVHAAWPMITAHVVQHEGDGYHTHAELYRYRMLYNAHAAKAWADKGVAVKSWRHSDGELCFDGGWFVVVATLHPHGQVSNHYEAEHWDLFDVPEVERAPEWDGHTPAEAADRLAAALRTPDAGVGGGERG